MTDTTFSIAAEWPTEPTEDRRDVAHISFWAEGESLTRLIDLQAKEERNYFRNSGVTLAFWFADNWWRLRYESLHDNRLPNANWRLKHELTSAPGGGLWPPLMFNSTGDRILIAPIFGRPVNEGSVRYVQPDVHSVGGTDFEAALDAFLAVVGDTCARAKDFGVLSELLTDLNAERRDPEIAAWRKLEARLGYDPDRAPGQLIQAFDELEKAVGEDGINEAAAAAPGRDSAEMLSRAIEASKASDLTIELGVARTISRTRIKSAAAPPWALGEEAAFQLRDQQGLPDGPLLSKALAALIDVTPNLITSASATAKRLLYSTRLRERSGRYKVALQSSNLRDRRFELACVLGDAVWAETDFGLVSKAKTDRQKFQRAFAQNLLVPYSDLKEELKTLDPTQEDIDRCGRKFHVHPQVIRRLLILRKVIRQETLEEQLEAA